MYSNEAITISNFLFRSPDELKVFDDLLRIKDIDRFKIIINLKRKGKSGVNSIVILSNELKENIQKLKNCSICHVVDEEFGYYEFDFLNIKETREAFDDNFTSVYNLFMCFQKFELIKSNKTWRKISKNQIKRSFIRGPASLGKR